MNKSSFRRSLFALTTGVMLLAVLPSAHAQTWSGNASGNNTWGNATNWVGSVAPVANGALTFNGTTQTTTNNNFAANTTFGTINFTNNGSAGQTGNFTLNGNAITVGGTITTTAATTGTLTDTINLNLILNSNRNINIGASHNLIINGLISESVAGSTFSKIGSGNLTVTNNLNSFTGLVTTQASGILNVTSIANGGSVSALGAGTQIQFGSANQGGTLNFTAGAASNNRTVLIGDNTSNTTSGGTIQNNTANGAGTLVFTASNFNSAQTSANLTRSLTLGGANTDANEIQGIIADNNTAGGGTIALVKADAGKWILSGANSYTGNTTISNGTLSVSSLANAGSASNLGNFTTAGATGLILSGGTLQYTGGNVSIDRGFTLSANSTINVNPASTVLTLGASSLGAFTLNATGGSGSSLALGATTLTGAATVNPTTANMTIASLSGNFAFTKSGAGTLNILGDATTGNGLTISTGGNSLTLSGNSSFTTLATNNGILNLSGANNTFSGLASVNAGGTVNVTGNANFKNANLSGTVNVNSGGNMTTAGAWALNSGSAVNINSGGNLTTLTGTTWNISGNATTTSYMTIASGGTMTNNITGLNVNSGSNMTVSGTYTGNVTGGISPNGGAVFTETGTGVLAGAMFFAVSNNATATLSGNNTYTGKTQIYGGSQGAGKLILDFSGVSAPTNNIIKSGNQLDFGTGAGPGQLTIKGAGTAANNTQTLAISNLGFGAQGIVVNNNGGSGTTTLGLTTTFVGWRKAGGGTINFDLSQGLGGGGTNAITTSGSAGTVLGFATLKDATGTGFATYNGTNIVRLTGQTALAVGSTGSATNFSTTPVGTSTTGSPYLTLNSSLNPSYNTLTIDTGSATGANVLDLGANTVTLTQNALLMNGANDYTVQNGQLGATAAELIVHTMGTGNLTIASGANISSGAGSLTKSGPGRLIIAGAQTYTGATTLNQGTLQLNNANSLQNSTLTPVNGGGTLAFNSGIGTFNIAGLSYAGPNSTGINAAIITLTDTASAAVTLSVGANNASTTYNGSFSGGGNLIKVGTGTLTLGSFSNFTGNVTVNGGTLTAGLGAAVLGSTTATRTITVNNGGTLDFGTSSDVLGGVGTVPTATLVVNSGGLVTNGNTSVITLGNINLNGGTMYAGAGNNVGDSYRLDGTTITVGGTSASTMAGLGGANSGYKFGLNDMTFNVADVTSSAAADLVVSGNITGTNGTQAKGFGFTKTGAGTMLLSAANTYTGNTTVSNGALVVTSATGLGTGNTTKTVSVASGAALNYNAAADAQLAVTTNLAITGGAGTTIGGSIGSTTTSAEINVTGNATISNAAHTVNIYGIPSTTPATGNYTLIHGTGAGSNLAPATAPTLGLVYNNTNFTVGSFTRNATDLQVGVTSATALTSAYWTGGLTNATNVWAASNGTSASNWVATSGGSAQALVPGSGADLYISNSTVTTAPTATLLGANMSIKSLTINDTTNGLGLNADGYTLTVGAGGITVASSVPASTIAAPVVIGANQTWTNNSANLLTVSGGVNFTNNTTLTFAGSGNTTLAGSAVISQITPVGASGAINLNAGTGTVTISAPIFMTSAQTWTNSSTNPFIISGVISSNATTSSLRFGNAGNTTLSGLNTFTSVLYINTGTVNINTIADFGTASSVGAGIAGSSMQLGNSGNSATLNYTGIGNTSNRTFQLGSAAVGAGSGTIQNNGSGNLTFTAPTFNTQATYAAGTGVDRILTLGGANTGNNTIQGIIQDNLIGTATGSAKVGLTKADAGTWVLSGNNTYTGATTINLGKLVINGNQTLSTGAVTVASGGTLGGSGIIGGATTIQSGGNLATGNSIGTQTFLNGLTIAGTDTVELGTAGATSPAGTSDRAAVTGALNITGATLVLADNAGANGQGSAGAGAYRIATYTTTLTGTFSGGITNPMSASLHEKVIYGPASGGGAVDLNLYRLATGSASATLGLGNVHVGGSLAGNISVNNSATADGFSEALNATGGSNSGNVTSAGSFSALAAGSSNNVSVALDATSAGAKSGTTTVSFASNGTGTSGYGTTAAGSQVVTVNGGVYNYAAANTITTPVSLTNVHVGDSFGTSALSIQNTAAAGSYTEKLDAAFTGTTGSASNNGGSIGLLAGNGTDSASLVVGLGGSTHTGTAGAVTGTTTISFTSNGTGTSGLANSSAGSQVVTVSGGVYNYAAANTITTPVSLTNVHVGDSFGTSALSIQNTAAAGSYTEGLNATKGSVGGDASVTGTNISNLAGGASSTAISVGLGLADTSTAGAKTGTVAIGFVSNGTNSGLSNTSLTGQTVTVNGGVYDYAAANTIATPVSLGKVRVGGSFGTSALSIQNTAANNGYSEKLDASFTGTTGSASNNGGSISLLTAQGTNNTSMVVGLGGNATTGTSGIKSGTTTIGLTSNGFGTSGLGTTDLTAQTVSISGTVYDHATPVIAHVSGGTFGVVDATHYTLDFGTGLTAGTLYTAHLTLTNAQLSAYQDSLKGAYAVTGSGFSSSLDGLTFSGLAADGTSSNAIDITFTSMTGGTVNGTFALSGLFGSTTGLSDEALADITISLSGAISAVPEPSTYAALAGAMMLVLAIYRRRRS